MNKENLIKNISLVPHKKSPTPAKNTSTATTFNNIRHLNSKSFVRQNLQIDHSLSPISTKRTKTNASNTYRVQSSILQTEVSESMLGHNLMYAFKLERQSLMNTLKMYKQQVEMLSQDNSRLKKENTKVRSALKEKQEVIEECKSKSEELQKKVDQYENMLPKLIELQQLQQKIIHQNNGLKSKIKVHEALLNNVANIARSSQTKCSTIDRIYTLTQSYLVSSGALAKKAK